MALRAAAGDSERLLVGVLLSESSLLKECVDEDDGGDCLMHKSAYQFVMLMMWPEGGPQGNGVR